MTAKILLIVFAVLFATVIVVAIIELAKELNPLAVNYRHKLKHFIRKHANHLKEFGLPNEYPPNKCLICGEIKGVIPASFGFSCWECHACVNDLRGGPDNGKEVYLLEYLRFWKDFDELWAKYNYKNKPLKFIKKELDKIKTAK